MMDNILIFSQWIDKFLNEKGVNVDETFDIIGPSGLNIMAYSNVVEAMKTTTSQERIAIKAMLIKLDFINSDIKKYLRHLAQAIAF